MGFYGSERYCIELATAQARAGHSDRGPGGGRRIRQCARLPPRDRGDESRAEASAGTIALDVIPKQMPAWLHRPFARARARRVSAGHRCTTHLNPAARRVGRVAQQSASRTWRRCISITSRASTRVYGLIAIASWQARAHCGATSTARAAVIWNWLPAAVSAALARTTRADGLGLRKLWRADDATIVLGSNRPPCCRRNKDRTCWCAPFAVADFRIAHEPGPARDLGDGRSARAGGGRSRRTTAGSRWSRAAEIAPFLPRARRLCGPRVFEPFGLTILEAMRPACRWC